MTSQVLLTNLPKPRGVKPREGGLFVPTFPSALESVTYEQSFLGIAETNCSLASFCKFSRRART